MYKTRIVKISDDYFVEYKWVGSFWIALFSNKDIFWTRWSMVPDKSLKDARLTAIKCLRSHSLNYQDPIVIE